MPSAFILSVHSYPALPRAGQPAHQRYVPPNPLVLGRKPRKSPAPTTDRDRPVSRRSKPSSRTAFIGEQPNRSEEHTSELQSHSDLVCRLLLEKKKNDDSDMHQNKINNTHITHISRH